MKWLFVMTTMLVTLDMASAQQVIVQEPPAQQIQQPNQVIVKLPPQRVYVEDRPACVVNTMPVFDPQGNFVGYTSTKVCN